MPGYDRPCEDGENGLSDMLALGNDRWLTLERACLLGVPGAPAYNPVRVFEVTTRGADDVSGLPSLAGRRSALVPKRLVLDVDRGAAAGSRAALRARQQLRGAGLRPRRPARRAHGGAHERRQPPRHADHRVPLAGPAV